MALNAIAIHPKLSADGLPFAQTMIAENSCTVSPPKRSECRIELRRARRADVARMARESRRSTPHQAETAGFNAKKMLWDSFHQSIECWAIEVEGEGLAAVFGLGGCFALGEPWLYTTALVEKYPIAFVRVAREIVEMMLDLCPRLEGHILESYAPGVRFLHCLGFSFGETVEMGPNRAPFRKFILDR